MLRRVTVLVVWAGTLVAGSAGAREGMVEVASEAVRSVLESSWAERAGPGEAMEIVRLPTLAASAAGDLHVTWPDPPLSPGPRALTVDLRVDGRVVARSLANVILSREIPVWILTRSVARGDTVRASDLRREPRVWVTPPTRALTAEVPSRGFVTRRHLTAENWVRKTDVRAIPDVEAGDDVQLVVRTGEATVSIAAKVRRSGSVGDTILVLNPLSGAVVRAVLLDPGQAELGSAVSNRERSTR